MIRTITIDSPPVNQMTTALMRELTGELRAIRGDEKGVLIWGAGDHFSVGASPVERLPDKGGPELLGAMEALFAALDEVPVPVISLVRGSCFGTGLELAAACDFMVVSETAQLAFPEIRTGVLPAVAVARLPRRIGRGRVLDLLLTGREIDGKEAERIGLATLACPEHEVKPRGNDLAERFEAYSSEALRTLKRALRETEGMPYTEALAKTFSIYRDSVLPSPEAGEGLSAVVEKRQPRWRG